MQCMVILGRQHIKLNVFIFFSQPESTKSVEETGNRAQLCHVHPPRDPAEAKKA